MSMSLSLLSFLPAVDRGWKSMRMECDLPACHHTQLMRSIPGVKQGVRVGAQWYCCVDCFASAARETLSTLSMRRPLEIPRTPRLSLGLAMHRKGSLTNEQLRVAGFESQSRNEDFAQTVMRLGMATEQDIAAARAAQWGCPVLSQDYVRQGVRADLPRAIFEACAAAPLHYSRTANRLLLGFVYRVEHSVLASIEQMTGCRVEPCFMTQTDYELQMTALSGQPGYDEIFVSDPGPADKMARTVGRAAVDSGAREARFTRYKNLVWTRLAGKRGTVDVVFRVSQVLAELKAEESEFFDEVVAVAG
jgi:hypothetical protein